MITHKQQINDSTCVQACIAMVSGESVEEIVSIAKTDKGLGVKREGAVLDELGLFWNRLSLPTLIPGCTHMISVPSLNIIGAMHRIVVGVDGDMLYWVLDPNEGREGEEVYTTGNLRSWSEVVIVCPLYHSSRNPYLR